MSSTARLLALGLLLSAFGCASSASHRPGSKDWYEGGDLHAKSLLDWQKATPANKLATCADFVAQGWTKKMFNPQLQTSIKGMDEMKPLAESLVKGLDKMSERDPDEATNKKMFTNQKVSDSAVLVMIAAKWIK